ncbi:hypothetical protein [Dyadobacter pollutisoli]|uniref:Uncharacterized protein n=1 Tax=Dyadobacter pollutisoli TaxID=2910158 RepID=A0A9E8NDW4_9BACT|nr:hypothetical protein [Dyadobacter pollutisoli]WAC14959.1 hypothetical protein ON006_13535 [Dyadobacter pollutisoli]
MTKRALIYFLIIFQLVAFASHAAHKSGKTRPKFKRFYFVPRPAPSEAQLEILRIKKLVQKSRPIIRVDKAKWKEDLTRLLLHRHTSYANPAFSAYIPSGISLASLRATSTFIVDMPPHQQRVVHLPGYYSFLHRLCPF